ncbi:permease YjgP/YjgQ family protein [gamma proteobacterium HTCC5015]|nr:permease YjgP/YjgQ family protein [gamma proteobacterium HTCC5015]
MHITDRYLIREVAKSSAAVLLVLLVLMVGNTLVQLLSDAADGNMAPQYIWPLLVITLANYLVLFMGLSLYLGGMLAFGRLYKDAEMAAMVACGMGPWDFFRPLFKVAIPISLAGLVLSVFILPWMAGLQAKFTSDAEKPSVETHLREGEFNELGNGIFFVEEQSGGALSQVFVYSRDPSGESIQVAESGRVEDAPSGYELTLQQGRLYQINTEQRIRDIRYQEYEVMVESPNAVVDEQVLAATQTSDLMRSDNPLEVAEWQWRLSVPIGCLLLAVLAFPLSYTSPRKGAFSKLGYAILVYILYSNFLSLGRSLVQNQEVPLWLGMWWAHLPVLALIIGLLLRRYGWPRRVEVA